MNDYIDIVDIDKDYLLNESKVFCMFPVVAFKCYT